MKNKKYKKKIISKFIIILFFLILFLIGILVTFNFNTEEKYAKNKLLYINSNEWNDEIYPDGMPQLVNYYKGNLTAQNIGKSISYVTNEVIPKYYNKMYNLSEEDIKKYYNDNKDTIYLEIGSITKDEFVLFIKDIQKIGCENMMLENYFIDKDTILTKNNYTIANLHINYKRCKQLQIEVQILNETRTDSSSVKYYD